MNSFSYDGGHSFPKRNGLALRLQDEVRFGLDRFLEETGQQNLSQARIEDLFNIMVNCLIFNQRNFIVDETNPNLLAVRTVDDLLEAFALRYEADTEEGFGASGPIKGLVFSDSDPNSMVYVHKRRGEVSATGTVVIDFPGERMPIYNEHVTRYPELKEIVDSLAEEIKFTDKTLGEVCKFAVRKDCRGNGIEHPSLLKTFKTGLDSLNIRFGLCSVPIKAYEKTTGETGAKLLHRSPEYGGRIQKESVTLLIDPNDLNSTFLRGTVNKYFEQL